MGDSKLNTNMASEFYVLSMLHRLGVNASLTLGNKKAIDIVAYKNGTSLTIDVKGLKNKGTFPVDNCTTRKKYHYYIFVSFLGEMLDPAIVPEAYIVPSLDVDKIHKELEGEDFVYYSPQGKKRVWYTTLKKLREKYLHKWDVFCEMN